MKDKIECQLDWKIKSIFDWGLKHFQEHIVILKYITSCGASRVELWDTQKGYPPDQVSIRLKYYFPKRVNEGAPPTFLIPTRTFRCMGTKRILNPKTKTLIWTYEEVEE